MRTAVNASYTEVNYAINGGGSGFVGAAPDGETVVIPAGSATWPTQITINNAITVQGNGIGSTIITSSIPQAAGNGFQSVFLLNTQLGKSYRITGIEFLASGRNQPSGVSNGLIAPRGYSHNIRIDNCRFAVSDQRSIQTGDDSWGVIDHCVFDSKFQKCFFGHSAYAGGTNGDGSWSSPSSFGAADGWYIEDCTAIPTGATTKVGLVDSEFGGRYCVRYCPSLDNHTINTHGTQGDQADRSCRSLEVYNNTFINLTSTAVDTRGGSAVIHDNTLTGGTATTVILNVNDYRAVNLPGGRWEGANGQSTRDNNYAGGPFYTGSHTGVSGATILTDAFANFPDIAGYSIYHVSQQRHSIIKSNTANTITYGAPTVGGTLIAWNPTDAYQIWRIRHSIDMPGMGQDDGIDRVTTSPTYLHWPNQTVEGCYVWNNTRSGVTLGVRNTDYPHILPGVHTFTITKPLYTPYTYPHPIVNPQGGKVIVLSGSLSFGNVIVGQTTNLSLTINNTGTSDMTVTSISYPAGFSGAFAGTVVAGGSHVVTVTFAPLLAQGYGGTITVNCDAGSGTNTIATSGTGVEAAITGASAPRGLVILRE